MKKILSILLMIFASVFLVSCTNGSESKTITIYYPSSNEESVAFVTRDIEVTSNDKLELLESVKDALLEGPENQNEDYKNIYNNIVIISYVTLENKLLVVNLEGDYYALTTSEKLALKTGIAKSYSNFRFVEKIRFLQKGQTIVDEYGNKSEDLNIEDIITEMDNDNVASNIANYNLYFGTADGKMLYREERALEVQTSVLLAKELVEELIAGPTVEGLLDTLPKQTKIRELEIKDGICYVDFNKDFKTRHPGGEDAETLTIYSIVNTLTELPEVERVQFLIDGEKNDEYQGYYEFNTPFTRDSTLIYSPGIIITEKNNPDNIISDLTQTDEDEEDSSDENGSEENLANGDADTSVESNASQTTSSLLTSNNLGIDNTKAVETLDDLIVTNSSSK